MRGYIGTVEKYAEYTMREYGGVVGGDVGIESWTEPHCGTEVCRPRILTS